MAGNALTSARRKKRIDVYLLTSIVSFVFLTISFIATLNTSPKQPLEKFFVVCTIAFSMVWGVFLFAWAIRHNKREALEKAAHTPRPSFNLSEDYKATHDVSDVVIFSILFVAFTLLAFFFAYGRSVWGLVLSVLFSIFSCVSLYRSLFFSVLFTHKLIVVEMKPFIQYSESYDSVSAIHFMPGNRKIIFSDGRNLNLGYGLGDSRRIAAILQKHVDVVPEQRWHLL